MKRASNLVIFCAFVFSLSALTAETEAARILGFFPSTSKSHNIIHCAVADTLARAGHNVTVIGTIPNVNKNAKYNFIRVDLPSHHDPAVMQDIVNNPQPFYKKLPSIINMFGTAANNSISHPTMQQFLRDNQAGSFDLLILGYFLNDFHLGLGAHFQCPIVVDFMIQPIFTLNAMIANPIEAAYVPVLMSNMKQPMNFWERVLNYMMAAFEENVSNRMILHKQQSLYDYHFPASRYPSLDEVRKNVSLLLTNHHSISQGPIRPNVPAIIEVGGIQIKEKPDPLPADIAQFIDNAKEGVIYFSLGSNIQGTVLTKDKSQLMFDVLSKVPYKVLWKWGDSDFPGESANIKYASWLPQDDILAHPNIKLFITHGGQGSVVESQYHGKPMVGIPFFGDQPANMANVERLGYGLKLDYASLTAEQFKHAILEVIQKPKYAVAVKQFSELYRDRPMTPRETIRFWIDYVLRHKGAKHLQSPALLLNWWQLNSWDVLAFLWGTVAAVVGIFVLLCKVLCCRGKKTVKNETKKNAAKTKKNK